MATEGDRFRACDPSREAGLKPDIMDGPPISLVLSSESIGNSGRSTKTGITSRWYSANQPRSHFCINGSQFGGGRHAIRSKAVWVRWLKNGHAGVRCAWVRFGSLPTARAA